MMPIGAFETVVPNLVIVVEAEALVQPFPTPPVPAEAPPVPRPHEMPPYLLPYPVLDIGETSTRLSYSEVTQPLSFGLMMSMTRLPGCGTNRLKMSLSSRKSFVLAFILGVMCTPTCCSGSFPCKSQIQGS